MSKTLKTRILTEYLNHIGLLKDFCYDATENPDNAKLWRKKYDKKAIAWVASQG